MELLTCTAKTLFLFAITFIPLYRQIEGFDRYHIGNMTAYRVAGLGLRQILFSFNNGTPLPVLCMSLLYDLFKSDITKYKLFHISLSSCLTPLLYAVATLLTGSEQTGFIAACLYGISYNFPVNLNWFVEPEHYELCVTLSGAALALYAQSRQSLPLMAAGFLLLGTSQLCKFPGLLSIWFSIVIVHASGDIAPPPIMFAAYAAPSVLFLAARTLLQQKITPTVSTKTATNIFARVYGQYYYRFISDPKKYLQEMFVRRFQCYSGQMLPLIMFATYYGISTTRDESWLLGSGLLFVSLIFLLRATLWYTHSFNLLLCICAALGYQHFIATINGPLLILFTLSIIYCYRSVLKDPYFSRLFEQRQHVETALDRIAQYVKQQLPVDSSWFFNVNNGYSYVYPLSERGFPHYFSPMLMGAYGPGRFDNDNIPPHLYDEGGRLLEACLHRPPDYVVQATGEFPIVQLGYLQHFCSVNYQVVDLFDSFVVYQRTDLNHLQMTALDAYDERELFNVQGGLDEACFAATSFIMQMRQRLEELHQGQKPALHAAS